MKKFTYFRLFWKSPGCLKDEAVEYKKYDEGEPVVGNYQSCVENWIFEELDHALSWGQITFAGEMFPSKDAEEEEEGWQSPGYNYHRYHLQQQIVQNSRFRN